MNRKKTILFGDKIFARVTRNGHTVLNFVSEKVSNMADLLSQIRIAMKDIQGLVMVYIRNYNQGWGDERPLMLYARKKEIYSFMNQKVERISATQGAREMYFPWETH